MQAMHNVRVLRDGLALIAALVIQMQQLVLFVAGAVSARLSWAGSACVMYQ
jgi:hypothetical protein